MKTVKFYTLGCKVNLYETEAMKGLFSDKGYIITEADDADIFIINTCTVTAVGDKKSRQMIRRAKKLNKNSIVAVVGCYAQVSPEEVAKMEEVDIILGTTGRKNIVEYIESYSGEKMNMVNGDIPAVYENITSCEQSRTRATIKIQDGCRSFCSYCIIPYARGPLRSRNPEEIVAEVTDLVKKGYKEFVFVGINLAAYHYDGLIIGDIVEKVCNIDGVERVRLGSLEPNVFTPKFLDIVKNQPKLCGHFHISLQSGCTETLKRMNRRYTAEKYLEYLGKIRDIRPDVNFTTDVMVGFPGETEQEFNQSLATVEKAKFGSIHVFPYSIRPGTPAATMENQVDGSVKHQRADVMAKLGDKLQKETLESYVGKTVSVLFETEEKGCFEGFTDNYIKVIAKGKNLFGDIKEVKITGYKKDTLTGEVL